MLTKQETTEKVLLGAEPGVRKLRRSTLPFGSQSLVLWSWG